MDIEIKQISKNDFNIARKFAIEGMNLNWYASNNFELYLYSKYFWYLEISKATKALGAYIDNELVGILLVDMVNQPKVFSSIWYKIIIKIVTFILNIGYKDASSTYDNANIEMLEEFKNNNKVDGEIIFFVADPTIKGKGIGSLLLNELERQEKGKLIYLYTDSSCTYQFYLKRDFNEEKRKDVTLKINKKEVSLTCFLFSRIL